MADKTVPNGATSADTINPAPPASTGDTLERRERLEAKAEQLSSLLSILRGQGGESFRTYSDEIQESVLWLASDLADEVRELAYAVDTAKGGAA